VLPQRRCLETCGAIAGVETRLSVHKIADLANVLEGDERAVLSRGINVIFTRCRLRVEEIRRVQE
jgi:hypothetical protein